MKKNKRLILIDGSAYIFRAYYALPPMSRKDGTPVNAVFGFTNMLVKLIEDYKEDKLIVIFDAARENFRNKIYKEYKANRGETPEDLIPQFDLIKQCVTAFKIPQLEIEGYEADDIIGTYSDLASKLKLSSLIVSSDKDLMQLVNESVEMLDPMKNKKIGISEVIEKFGVKPSKVVQIQALTGDKVDNIPGAPGIGPKTALELIKEFGDIENLIKNADKIKQEKRKNIIKDSQDDIRISLQLVSLDKKIDLPLTIDDIKPFAEIDDNKSSINIFLREQGFRAIEQRLHNNSFIGISKENFDIKNKNQSLEYILINNISELKKILEECKNKGTVAIDTETNSLNLEKATLVGISLSYNEEKAFYIPINHKDIESGKRLKEQLDEKQVLEQIKLVCSDSSILKIGQNLKYDIRLLKKYNVTFNSIDDTMLLSYALDNGLTRHGMDELSYRHLNHETIKYKDLVGSGKKQISFDYVSIDEATKYAAEDALITLKLYNILKTRLIKEKASYVYEKIDKPLIKVLSLMEEKGIKVDSKYLHKLSKEFLKESTKIEKLIFKITGKEFNIGSPKQLGEILFLEMKIKGGKKTKTGTYSTDSGILEDLSLQGHEIAKLVLEWREVSKLRSTYTDALQHQIDTNTNRVHTSYATATTLTGRLSSNDPNLQNIPIRTDKGRQIRRERLRTTFGEQVACYFGGGGERWDGETQTWKRLTKEQVKDLFRRGEGVRILIGTDSMSEGLNLQTCDRLINFDLPWNFMRVEQRIGRVDRIGGRQNILVTNLFYKGTVEQDIYNRIKDRHDWFTHVVGNAQPVLAATESVIQRAALGRISGEEAAGELNGLIDQLENADLQIEDLDAVPHHEKSLTPKMNLTELKEALFTIKAAEERFYEHPSILNAWFVEVGGSKHEVTFDPRTYNEEVGLNMFSWGTELFEQLLDELEAGSGTI